MKKSMVDDIAADVGKDYGVEDNGDDEAADGEGATDDYDAEESAATDELLSGLGVKGADKTKVQAALRDFIDACIARNK